MRCFRALTWVALVMAATAQAASEPPPPLVRADNTVLRKPSAEWVRPWPLPDPPAHSGPFVFSPKGTAALCSAVEYPDGCNRPARAPDIDGLLIVLLQSFAPDPAQSIQPSALWYITVADADGTRHDPSPGVLGSVHIWNIRMVGGSGAPEANAFLTKTPRQLMHYTIEAPRPRQDGNYEVSYAYYCGSLCAAGFTAVMSHDAQGWHILSTNMEWIS